MNICDDCEDISFDYGDRVRLVINPLVSGQVIGERNWGQEYQVRVVGMLAAVWYEHVEIEPDPEFFPPAAAMTPPVVPVGDEKVISLAQVRATKGRVL